MKVRKSGCPNSRAVARAAQTLQIKKANAKRVVALVEGSFGFNLELVVENLDGHYQHYWRDGNGWHAGVVIV